MFRTGIVIGMTNLSSDQQWAVSEHAAFQQEVLNKYSVYWQMVFGQYVAVTVLACITIFFGATAAQILFVLTASAVFETIIVLFKTRDSKIIRCQVESFLLCDDVSDEWKQTHRCLVGEARRARALTRRSV